MKRPSGVALFSTLLLSTQILANQSPELEFKVASIEQVQGNQRYSCTHVAKTKLCNNTSSTIELPIKRCAGATPLVRNFSDNPVIVPIKISECYGRIEETKLVIQPQGCSEEFITYLKAVDRDAWEYLPFHLAIEPEGLGKAIWSSTVALKTSESYILSLPTPPEIIPGFGLKIKTVNPARDVDGFVVATKLCNDTWLPKTLAMSSCNNKVFLPHFKTDNVAFTVMNEVECEGIVAKSNLWLKPKGCSHDFKALVKIDSAISPETLPFRLGFQAEGWDTPILWSSTTTLSMPNPAIQRSQPTALRR
jgi:hypothetical protein